MSDPTLELQEAIVARLKQPDTLPDGVRVFDQPPAAAVAPYISFGPSQNLPDKADCIDGAEAFQQLDVWSAEPGFVQARRIVKAVLAALDEKPLDVWDFDLVTLEFQSVNYLRDPDGVTAHAAITFRALLTPQ